MNDAATGRPTPVRIRFVSAAGEYFAPFGRLTEFATDSYQDVGGNVLHDDGNEYAYIDGACEIRLPPSPVLVETHKGPEYRPGLHEVTLGAGKMALRLGVERWVDLRREGWYSGDIRAYWLSPHAALLEAAAEDLAVVNLLAGDQFTLSRGKVDVINEPLPPDEPPTTVARIRYEFHEGFCQAIPNILAFSGQQPALQAPGHLVVVNTENHHPVLGTLALLNCHRPVYPLSFGGPDGPDNWTLADWCDQCHRKGGLVVWTRAVCQTGSGVSRYGEALADLVLGKVDAIDCGTSGWGKADWYELLNAGLRLPVVGGSAKHSNLEVLGDWRTYARLLPGAQFSYRNWIEAVRAGRTFITKGPLLAFTVNGQDPGAVLGVPAEAPAVHVRAEARSLDPFARLQVLANGAVVAESSPAEATRSAVVEADAVLPAGGWVAACCWEQRSPTSLTLAAHTSPVYVHVEGRPPRADPAALATLLEDLDGTLKWAQRQARCENDQQREHLAGIFQAAREELLRRQGA